LKPSNPLLMKRFITAVLPVVTGMIFLTNCKQEAQQSQLPPPEVQVIQVIQKDFPRIREFVGQTFGQADIAIRARVEGFLEGIHFEEGMPVRKGQHLYTIDPQPFLAKEAEALGNLAEAKTILVKAKADLDRIRPLAEINAVSKADLDFAVAQYGAAEASVEAAEAALRAARIQLVVLNTVSNIETVQVRFFLTEDEYIFLTRYFDPDDFREDRSERKRENLTLVLSDGCIHPQKGTVDFVDRSVDPRTGSILIQSTFPNPRQALRPGQFARVVLEFEMVRDALLLPQRCITELQGQQSVFVVDENNVIEFRQVEASVTRDGLWLIESGLQPGEQVVFEGIQKVRSGMTVKTVQAEYNPPSGEAVESSTTN
jgi:membrane fusion protein (multidrug efflux system)